MNITEFYIILLFSAILHVSLEYEGLWRKFFYRPKPALQDHKNYNGYSSLEGIYNNDKIVDIAIWMKSSQDDDTVAQLLAKDYSIHYYGMVPELGIRHFRIIPKPQGHMKRSFNANIFEALSIDPRVDRVMHGSVLKRSKREVDLFHSIYSDEYYDDSSTYQDGFDDDHSISFKFKEMEFNDPLYYRQWYYENPTGNDLNILDAWKKGYSGAGITICILDDGLDHEHVELKRRYIANVSYDFNDLDDTEHDPAPRTEDADNGHGTKCAGTAVAEANNKFCGVGVAFKAHICGHRILDGVLTPLLEARTISYKNRYVHIKSISWGPVDDGKHMETPSKLVKRAIENGLNDGRYGKGTLFVWASGNGGRNNDHCGADGYVSYPYVLAIGSITSDGNAPSYSEKCPATLAVAYVGGKSIASHATFLKKSYGIVTSDVGNKCTDQFVGTSAAAPIAAGIFALVLEANPNLTYRDVMHLVAKTSRIPSLNGWDTWWLNGGGYHTSCSFGFGVLDASQLVQAAQNWKNVGPRCSCTSKTYINNPRVLTPGSNTEIHININRCPKIDQVELAVMTVSCRYPIRGDLRFTLISPSGMPSVLLNFRALDRTNRGIRKFPFMSAQFWGEKPLGTWKLVIETRDTATDTFFVNGSLYFWKLTLYGTTRWNTKIDRNGNVSARKLTLEDVKKIIEYENELKNTKIISK